MPYRLVWINRYRGESAKLSHHPGQLRDDNVSVNQSMGFPCFVNSLAVLPCGLFLLRVYFARWFEYNVRRKR